MTVTRQPWREPGWRADADAWIAEQLARLGVRAQGPVVEHRVRFWSVHLTVETDAGRYWFKQNAPTQAFEAELLVALGATHPDRVLVPAAIDAGNGRMLSPDQGRTLREAGPVGAAVWTALLVDYAQLQRSSADLSGVGLTTMDPADALDYLDRWSSFWRALPVDDPRHLGGAAATALDTRRGQVARWAEELAASGLPLTVEHSDLHSGNAFATGPGRPVRVFDFGDAVLAHPLCSLLVPWRSMRHHEDGTVRLTDREIDGVVDAYLEVFSDLAPMAQLRRLVQPALQIAVLDRHESWRRAVETADEDDPSYADFASAPAGWLELLGTDL